MVVIKGCQNDYLDMARYHYEPQLSFPPTIVFKVVGTNRYYHHFPDPVAVMVLSPPLPHIKARNEATSNFFQQHSSQAENLTILNKYVLYLSRLIVSPRLRKRGIANFLLREALGRMQIPIIETLTPIDFTNEMYTKVGFELYYTPNPPRYTRLINAFSAVGLDVKDTTSPMLIDGRLERMQPVEREFIEKEICRFLSGFRNADRFKPGTERTKYILSKVPPPNAYLIWFNPNAPLSKVVLLYREKREQQIKNNNHSVVDTAIKSGIVGVDKRRGWIKLHNNAKLTPQ